MAAASSQQPRGGLKGERCCEDAAEEQGGLRVENIRKETELKCRPWRKQATPFSICGDAGTPQANGDVAKVDATRDLHREAKRWQRSEQGMDAQ